MKRVHLDEYEYGGLGAYECTPGAGFEVEIPDDLYQRWQAAQAAVVEARAVEAEVYGLWSDAYVADWEAKK